MGTLDTEDYKYEVMLGVWKPIHPEKVSNCYLTEFDLKCGSVYRFVMLHWQLWMPGQ